MTGLLVPLAGLGVAIACVAFFWYRSAQRAQIRQRWHGDQIR